MKEDNHYQWIEEKYGFKVTAKIRNTLTEYFESEYNFKSIEYFEDYNSKMLNLNK